jgi:hypothetical protein
MWRQTPTLSLFFNSITSSELSAWHCLGANLKSSFNTDICCSIYTVLSNTLLTKLVFSFIPYLFSLPSSNDVIISPSRTDWDCPVFFNSSDHIPTSSSHNSLQSQITSFLFCSFTSLSLSLFLCVCVHVHICLFLSSPWNYKFLSRKF